MHVCFANLASLHVYLTDLERARCFIKTALKLDPENEVYRKIGKELL